MPYLQSKIKQKLRSFYDAPLYQGYLADLQLVLGLTRLPVGVKLFFSREEYAASPEAEFSGKMTYCMMVKQATGSNWGYKTRLEHHSCDGGTTALGLEPSTTRIESGREYFSYNLFENPAIARRLRQSVNSLHFFQPETYGVAIKPLADFMAAPDVILVICQAYQAMRLLQGEVWYSGKKPALDMGAMQGICSEVTVTPYLSGEINLSVLCPSTRTLCQWQDDELAVGIPTEKFPAIVEGVFATLKATESKKHQREIADRFMAAKRELPLVLEIGKD
jgi:uncharacterized protein (DUF169 family)